MSAPAQDNQSPKETGEQKNAGALDAFMRESNSNDAERTLRMYGVDAFPCDKETADEQTYKSCLSARKAYYEYYVTALPRRTRVYEWNNLSTKVIFLIVLSLVAVGVYFSWKQFFGTIVPPAAPSEAGDKTEDRQLVTELEMGLAGIKVRSPILGVILLTVSLAFFYLYLKFVYPVTNNF